MSKKEEVVYIAVNAPQSNFMETPSPLMKELREWYTPKNVKRSMLLCPSVTEYWENTFVIKSHLNLKFEKGEDNRLYTNDLNQEDYETYINYHDKDHGIFGFSTGFWAVPQSDDLVMEQRHPLYSDTSFSNSVDIIEGHVNVGKYPRPIECAYKLHSGVNQVKLNIGDPMFYSRFLTNNKIKLVRFAFTDELNNLINPHVGINSRIYNKRNILQAHYDAFKRINLKKVILKKIKEVAE
jgi:hypothetical protein